MRAIGLTIAGKGVCSSHQRGLNVQGSWEENPRGRDTRLGFMQQCKCHFNFNTQMYQRSLFFVN